MNAPRFRGICPGLSAPMATGDGLLARLRPTAPIPPDAMVGFCAAARRHGNGIIEISARGSLQVRGLTPRSAPLFASAVAELGIATHEGVPVIAGFDGGAADLVAAELRRAIADARLALSPKASIVVDGGGSLHLDALSADVRLRAAGSAQGPRFHLGIGGDGSRERTALPLPLPPKGGEGRGEGGVPRRSDSRHTPLIPAFSPLWGEKERAAATGGASATWLGMVAPKDAVGAVLHILTIIASHGPTARAAEILRAAEGAEAFRSISTVIEPSSAPPQRVPAEMIGLHSAHDGTVAVAIGLAFGHTHADALAEIVRLAAAHGTQAVWPLPDRALLLIGVSEPDALDLTAAAEQLGFVVHAGDPRRRIAACPGAPACASGLIPARALASVLAPILESIGTSLRRDRAAETTCGIAVHISGCPKGCAHPMPAALTLVGTPRGCGIVPHGSARMTPGHYVDPANLGDEISRFTTSSKGAAHG